MAVTAGIIATAITGVTAMTGTITTGGIDGRVNHGVTTIVTASTRAAATISTGSTASNPERSYDCGAAAAAGSATGATERVRPRQARASVARRGSRGSRSHSVLTRAAKNRPTRDAPLRRVAARARPAPAGMRAHSR